jgi:tetratricopeptide (TPR) repeat protein
MRPPPAAPALLLLAAGLLAGCPGSGDGGAAKPGDAGGPDPAVAAALAKRPDLARDRVFLLGLDGCDPLLVRRLADAGKLPNFKRLMEEGAFGPLHSQQPMLSPLLWTTIATGKWPTEHGVLDFMVRSRTDPAAREAVTSRNRQVESIWDIAGRYGRNVGVVGWLASHPAEEVNGFAVSERTELLAYLFNEGIAPSDEGKTWPPGLLAEIAPLRRRPADVTWAEGKEFLHVTEEEWRAACTEDKFTAGNRTNNLRLILTAADNFRRVGAHLRREKSPALFCCYFEMLDAVGHNFMAYREPVTWVAQPLEEVQAFFRGSSEADPAVVEKAWRWARGKGPREGLEKLKPEVLSTISELSRGADPARVAQWKDAVDAAYAWTDRLLGEAMAACDADTTLLVVSDHGFASGPQKPPFDSAFQSRVGGASFHMMDGVLGAWGRGVRKGFPIPPYDRVRPGTGARLLDIAPTVLALLGFPKAKDMPGRVLSEVFDLDLVVGGVESYEAGRSARLAKERVEEESRKPRTGKDGEDTAEGSLDEEMKQIMAVGYVGTAEEGPSRAFLHMAASYEEQGRLAEAEEALAEALKSARETSLRLNTLYRLGALRGKQGDREGARKRYLEALKENPSFVPALAGLCLLDQDAGDCASAVSGWERIAALQPSSGEFRIRLADALRLRSEASPGAGGDDLRRAVGLVREFVKTGKEDASAGDGVNPEGHNTIGMILLRAGEFPGAIDQFRKAAADRPGYRNPRTNLGVLHLNLANRFLADLDAARDPGKRMELEGQVRANRAEALRWLGEVIDREPDYAKALYNRAEVNFHIPPRDLAAAARDLEAALKADPKYARAAALLDKVRQATAGGR